MKALIILVISFALAGCGYNTFQQLDTQIEANQSKLLNAYKKRSDLVDQLVATVQGEANFEKSTLTEVIQARASATSIQVTPETLKDPAAMEKFQQAQSQLSGSLSRLLVSVERYPDLKANQGFRDLSKQLVNLETQINMTRNVLVNSIRSYNNQVKMFPTNLTAMMFGFTVKPQYKAGDEKTLEVAPKIQFGK